MDVAFVDDHVSVTCWPAWAEAGEALRATLGDAGGASCAAAIGFFPFAISASATKPNKTAVRSECKRIVFTPCVMEHLHGAGCAQMTPTHCSKDCGIARRCKLFLGADLEQGAMVLENPFLWPPMERRNPEVIGSSVGLVPINAQVSTNQRALPIGRQTGSYPETGFWEIAPLR